MSQSSLDRVTSQLKEDAIRIEDAIEAEEIPQALLHHFACDCTQRALSRLEKAGKEPDQESWDAVKAKRSWLLEEIDDEQLKEAHEAVMTTDRTTAWGVVRSNAHNAARNSVRSLVNTATEAVLWDKRRDAQYKELSWIKARFAYLCEVWQACGERSVALLHEEKCPIDTPEEAEIEHGLAD